MKRLLILVPVLSCFLLSAFPQSSSNEVQLGVSAYKNNHYDEATKHFEKAAELDPGNLTAHLYAGTALVSQYIPGVDTEENLAFAERAVTHYQRVLDANASREQKLNSAKGIAYLYLNMKKWEEAKTYYQMASSFDAKDAEAYYSIGVSDWTYCYSFRMEGRVKLEMTPDQHLSSRKPDQKKLCDELQARNGSTIEDGISNLEKAIELRPDYDDAMAYMNLMYRERADIECDNPMAREQDLKTADEWVDKAMAAKKAKAERKPIAK